MAGLVYDDTLGLVGVGIGVRALLAYRAQSFAYRSDS